MALASAIITAAYREGNLLSINASPTTAQQTEGLDRLNALLSATIGFDAGRSLRDLPIGGEYDATPSEYAPEDVRLITNLTAAQTIKLHPHPYDGQRIAIADAGNNLATYNLTLDGNGRRIEAASTVTLNTNNLTREWIYRADLGEWKRLSTLTASDSLPFPTDFDDYFIILLAMRLNPRYGQELQQGSAIWLEGMANRLEARYRKPRPLQEWGSLGLYGQGERSYGSFARGRA